VKQKQKEFLELLNAHKTITILSHIRPDGDALGTSLGIFNILKNAGFRVEIANFSKELPRNFDFLEGFSKIKNKIDFEDSLIITCDSGSIDRLGFDLSNKKIVNIDHHKSNTNYGILNIVDPNAVSSSFVAFYFLKDLFKIPKSAAIAFYTALLSDSLFFSTSSVDQRSFEFASKLVTLGVDPAKTAQMIQQRKSLASLRLLSIALDKLKLYKDGEIALVKITSKELEKTGAKEYDREGIVEYGKSLATVKISILLIELEDKVKVSFRSKDLDISKVAKSFGGGGHKEAAGFEIKGNIDEIENIVVEKIINGVLN
jgi:phosphoesterase RecJ-like protein